MKSYLTAEQLEIPEAWRNALIRVMHDLEARELPGKFDMNCWYREKSCGTVACIGGWCQAYMGVPFAEMDGPDLPHTLHPLFYPHGLCEPWENITRIQGAKAIEYFLRNGNAEKAWPHVLPREWLY